MIEKKEIKYIVNKEVLPAIALRSMVLFPGTVIHFDVARQKSILAALCREPGALLRIAPHQRSFRIAYGTARADFLGLESEGYLVREQEGRAFAFRAHPDLQEKIVQLGVAVVGSAEASSGEGSVVVS